MAMMFRICALSIVVLMSAYPELANAGSLCKVWELDVKKAPGEARWSIDRIPCLRLEILS
jgi:hypothetical protein